MCDLKWNNIETRHFSFSWSSLLAKPFLIIVLTFGDTKLGIYRENELFVLHLYHFRKCLAFIYSLSYSLLVNSMNF